MDRIMFLSWLEPHRTVQIILFVSVEIYSDSDSAQTVCVPVWGHMKGQWIDSSHKRRVKKNQLFLHPLLPRAIIAASFIFKTK